jgi:hypothetical protein
MRSGSNFANNYGAGQALTFYQHDWMKVLFTFHV